jgi:transposase
MYTVDEFLTAAEDSRLAVVAVAVVFGWPSARGLSVANIAGQLGVSASTISRACARFREMAGLDSNGAMQRIRPGAGSLMRQAGGGSSKFG